MGSVTQFPETPKFIDALTQWRETHAALAALAAASAAEQDIEAPLLAIAETIGPLGRAILADRKQAYYHGIALGLLHANRPEVILDLPEFVRAAVATMEGRDGTEMRRFLRQHTRGA